MRFKHGFREESLLSKKSINKGDFWQTGTILYKEKSLRGSGGETSSGLDKLIVCTAT